MENEDVDTDQLDDTFYSLVADEVPTIPEHDVSLYQDTVNTLPDPAGPAPAAVPDFTATNPAALPTDFTATTPTAPSALSSSPIHLDDSTIHLDDSTIVLSPDAIEGMQLAGDLRSTPNPALSLSPELSDPDQIEIGSIPSAVSPDVPLSPEHFSSLSPEIDGLGTSKPKHPVLEQLHQPPGSPSMQSISLTDSTENVSQFSELGTSADIPKGSDGSSPLDFSTVDVVEMPTLTGSTDPPQPHVTTPTSYFSGAAQFVQQISPEPGYDVINEDLSDSSIDSELWLPNAETFELIRQSISKPLDQQFLTQVSPSNTAPFVSPAVELVTKYHGEQAAQRLQTQMPPVAESNLKHLVKEGRLLSAVNMLTELLNKDSAMSVRNVKLWTLRFALLIKLKLYSTAEVEMSMFGNLDNCDLYFEYYPKDYPGRKGSIVPWSLRLLWSILPLHCPTAGGLYGALDRMYGLVYHLDQTVLAGLPYVQEQRVTKYKTSLLVQIAGALAGTGALQPAIKVLNQIKSLRPDISVPVTSAMIRLYYQVGNIHKGECLLASIQDKLSDEEREMNAGFKSIAHGEYKEAYQHFARVVNLNPGNTVATINGAVCLLYLGRLGDSIIQFEGAVKTSLHPMLLFNLVSLYELKTVASTTKKYLLLDSITSNSDWEAFPFECLRL